MPIDHTNTSYFSWSAVFAGAVISVAVGLTLQDFGAGIGLQYDESWLTGPAAMWNVLLAGLWIVLVALASMTAGGYVAGRMRPRWPDAEKDEAEIRDGCNGLAVWAAATVAVLGFAMIAPAEGSATVSDTASSGDLAVAIANAGQVLSFAAAASSALGAAAAWFAATLGGEHRDQNVPVSHLAPRFMRKQ